MPRLTMFSVISSVLVIVVALDGERATTFEQYTCEPLLADCAAKVNAWLPEAPPASAPEISMHDSIATVCTKLSHDSPRALALLDQVRVIATHIDPDNAMGALAVLLNLDSLGIYGENIWKLYKDVARERPNAFIGLLRAWQLGELDSRTLHYALEKHGECLNVCEAMARVKALLPAFKV